MKKKYKTDRKIRTNNESPTKNKQQPLKTRGGSVNSIVDEPTIHSTK